MLCGSEYDLLLPSGIKELRFITNFYFPGKASKAASILTDVLRNSSFFEITLRHGRFPSNMLERCRTCIQKNTTGELILNLIKCALFCFYYKYQTFHGFLLLFINFSVTINNYMESKAKKGCKKHHYPRQILDQTMFMIGENRQLAAQIKSLACRPACRETYQQQ